MNESADSKYKQINLKDVLNANPGISIPEAVVLLNAYNSAVVRGEVPPPLSGVGTNSNFPSSSSGSSMHILPDGSALTKPHREL
jgi:hypothetical protein